MSRGTAGLAAGAAATTVYLRPDILIDWVRNAAIPHQTGGNSSKEIGELTRLVRNHFIFTRISHPFHPNSWR